MVKLLLLLSLLGMMQANYPVPVNKADSTPIVIGNDNGEGIPNRAPVLIPISGYVDTSLDAAIITFNSPCGTVDVEFTNTTSGDTYRTSVAGTGIVVIPVSLSSGLWYVTFTLSTGEEYYGEFTI